jgi:hypothetical protein
MPRIVAAQFRRAAIDAVHNEPSPGQETILARPPEWAEVAGR